MEESWPSGVCLQGLAPNRLERHWLKTVGVSVEGKGVSMWCVRYGLIRAATMCRSQIKQSDNNIGQTTAVGIYPQQADDDAPADGVGNLWLWCLNEGKQTENTDEAGKGSRALRGGSWNFNAEIAALDLRNNNDPDNRNNNIGFRVFCVPDIFLAVQ